MNFQERSFQCYKLMLAMMLGFPIIPTIILMGGFIGTKISPYPSLVTLPIACAILGNVMGIIPANFFMQKFGTKLGFLYGNFHAMLFTLLAIFSIYQESFFVFCFSCFALGNSVSFVHQYRFEAASLIPENTVKAISLVLIGGIGGGILGPYLAKQSMNLFAIEFAGCFVILLVMNFCSFLILLTYRPAFVEKQESQKEKSRALSKIITQPLFIISVLIAAFGYGLMALLMTAAPLSMKHDSQIHINLVTVVIQTHLVAMYLPSLRSVWFIKKLGITKFIIGGILLNYLSYITGYLFQNFIGFLISLFLLGIGWNFLFVGGTYLVVKSYSKVEKFKAQACNDFFVFSVQAMGTLFSGTLLYYFSWQMLNIISFIIISFIFLIFYASKKKILEKVHYSF